MIAQKIMHRTQSSDGRLTAFCGAFLVHEFSGKHRDHNAGPVSDGMSEEGSEMSAGIGDAIKHDPSDQDRDRCQAQRVFSSEAGLCLSFVYHAYFSRSLEYAPVTSFSRDDLS